MTKLAFIAFALFLCLGCARSAPQAEHKTADYFTDVRLRIDGVDAGFEPQLKGGQPFDVAGSFLTTMSNYDISNMYLKIVTSPKHGRGEGGEVMLVGRVASLTHTGNRYEFRRSISIDESQVDRYRESHDFFLIVEESSSRRGLLARVPVQFQ